MRFEPPSELRSAVYIFTMTDPYNDDDHTFPVETINHSIIADSHPEMICFSLQFLCAGWTRIDTKFRNLATDPPLHSALQRFELTQCRPREFDRIAHIAPAYRPNCFLICVHGMVVSFRRLRASSRSILSSICSSNSTSSMGTTAATGFLRRCTITRSLPYATRFTMSEKLARAVLDVSRFAMGSRFSFCTFCTILT